MPVTPAWLAATSGQPGVAGQVNQFLGTHAAAVLYAGTQQAAQATAGSTSTSTASLYLAQEFTTGSSQAEAGYASIPLTTTITTGASLGPVTVSLCASASGAPGAVLASSAVTAEYAHHVSGGTPTTFITVPLPAAVTASTTYWITVSAGGTGGASFTWYRSNQSSGASTSPDGVTWTPQSYGFEFKVFDQSATGVMTAIWEDSGARWSAYTWSGSPSVPATIAEYTAGQTTAGYVQSYRAMTYSGGLLTGAS